MGFPAIILADLTPQWLNSISGALTSFVNQPWMGTVGIWIAAGLTLFMFSFVYKDNPFFKFGEHLYLGISAAYLMCVLWHQFFKPKFIFPLLPFTDPTGTAKLNLLVIIPGILGFFILLRLIPKLAWLSRITFAFYVGGFAGFMIYNVINGMFLPQFHSTLNPLSFTWVGFNNLVLLVGAFCVLVYFFFSLEHRGAIGHVSRIGIYFLMVAFGASFGYTIMARISLLIGRMQFLMFDWMHLDKIFPGAGM